MTSWPPWRAGSVPCAVPALEVRDGRRAWTTAAAAFAAMFTTFGVAYSFGAFLVPVSGGLGAGRAATSGVFATTTCALFALGALSGPAVDRFGPRRVVLVGTASTGLGLLLMSSAQSLWQAYLGHGLGVGLGVACTYVPLVAVVGGWFERHRTLAIGLAVSGIGLGTLLVAPLAAALIEQVGWRDAYRVLGAVSVVVLLAVAAVVRPAPVQVGQGRVPGLASRLRTPTYVRLYVAGVLLSSVLFIPFVHLPSYAVSSGTGEVAAAALVGLIGAASIVGRLALGVVAARTGVLRAYQGCYAVMTGSFLLWLGSPGYGRLALLALLLGLGYGGFVALGPPLMAELFGVRGLGGLLGVLYTSAALGSAVGPPAAAALASAAGGWSTVALVAVVIGSAATATCLSVRPGPRAA